MATSLARLSSCTPALRAFSAASFWNNIANADSTLHHTCCTKQEDVTVPSPASASPWGALSAPGALGSWQRRALYYPGPAGLGGSITYWPGTRSLASQPAEQQQQRQQQQQPQSQQPQSHPPPARPPPEATPQRPPNDVTYFGPLSQQHKLLKRISIANTLVAAAAAPAIVALADSISMTGRYGLAASLGFFGIITTGALHWVAHPYVHELRYTAATGQLDVRTTTLLGNSRWNSFNVDDVQPLPWSRPVATFTALGQFYYIDVYDFPDEQLLRRLTPDEADVPPGYKDKDDDDD